MTRSSYAELKACTAKAKIGSSFVDFREEHTAEQMPATAYVAEALPADTTLSGPNVIDPLTSIVWLLKETRAGEQRTNGDNEQESSQGSESAKLTVRKKGKEYE